MVAKRQRGNVLTSRACANDWRNDVTRVWNMLGGSTRTALGNTAGEKALTYASFPPSWSTRRDALKKNLTKFRKDHLSCEKKRY